MDGREFCYNMRFFVGTMKKLLLLLTLLPCLAYAQQPDLKRIADSISAEGWQLYRLEKAAWHGAAKALQQFPGLQTTVGGYFTYESGTRVNCIFYNVPSDSVVAEVSFDRTLNPEQASAKKQTRPLAPAEKDLLAIRKKALDLLQRDTVFKMYQQTSFNLVPVITPAERKVYVLTAPKVGGVVILGSDYLLRFDRNNNLVSRQAIHPAILPIEYKSAPVQDASFHNHTAESGDFITATDICTLMLYGEYAKWKKHTVVGEKYVSVWDAVKNTLTILPKKQFMDQAQKE
jgi:hypothetical protein